MSDRGARRLRRERRAVERNAPGVDGGLGGSAVGNDADERIILALLAAPRAGTLGLGLAETIQHVAWHHRSTGRIALVALTVQSLAVFGLALWRLRQHAGPVMDGRTAAVETVAGVAALVLVAFATKPQDRVGPTFWIETYTVITVIVIAAAVRRVALGAVSAMLLATTYLLSVLVESQGTNALSSADRATAWTNALSYLLFFAIGALGIAALRYVIVQTGELRLLLARLAAERARIAAASSAYRIGHDIPKALLREVRRGNLKAEQLRPWAESYRDDLTGMLSDEERPPVDLRDELSALAEAFAAACELRADLAALGETPLGAPALLIAEATRELLNNASFHAYGYPCTLAARSSATLVEVSVHNDGPGVDPVAVASTWARKHNSVHQLKAAGGRYEVISRAGSTSGTTVTLRWHAAAVEG